MCKVYLVCIAKLENLYVREFVEHYKDLNIDKIILYDNNDDHGEHFEEVINDYIQSGFVEIINVRGINPPFINGMFLQPFVYLDAYRRYSKDCDWICYFDIDELLILDEKYENNIKNFIYDKIIVSYMSDANNLHLAYMVMRTMVEYETYVPDKVVLNLSKTNVKEEDLPEDLMNYIKEHSDICEIYWCDTYTEFNRLFPTMERYPDDIIIPIHLNYKYTGDFIETLYKDYLTKGKSCPLSYYKPKDNETILDRFNEYIKQKYGNIQ